MTNRAQRRAAQFQRNRRPDRNAAVEPSFVLTPLLWSRPFDAEEAARLGNEVLLAWYHLTGGNGTQDRFDTLAVALNTGAIMAAGIDHGLLELFERAQHAAAAMQERYRRLGRFGAHAQALAHIPPALDAYDELLRHATPRQMADALKVAMRMIERRLVIGADEGGAP